MYKFEIHRTQRAGCARPARHERAAFARRLPRKWGGQCKLPAWLLLPAPKRHVSLPHADGQPCMADTVDAHTRRAGRTGPARRLFSAERFAAQPSWSSRARWFRPGPPGAAPLPP